MTDRRPDVSIVVAVYDDRASVAELAQRVEATLEARGAAFEIVFVDDGSRDGTLEALRDIEAHNPRVLVYELTRNFGQAAALACGLFAARGEVVVTLDGDLQNPPEEIPKLLDAIAAGAGVATARRGRRYEGVVRWLGSRFVHWLACRVTGVAIEDYGGNFKAYRRDVVESTKGMWAPGKPFFPLALWAGHRVAEVTVGHEPRRAGRSRYTLAALLRINFDIITAFTTLPLAMLGMLGVVGLAGGFAMLLVIGVLQTAGWLAPAIALTSMVIGAAFLASGVLGLYLGRVYRQVAGSEPAYVVRHGPREAPAQPAAL
jgi:undecaprenyl-phosphate 4-deoxy-4-formamido-L-arabinose transferase